MKPDYRRQIVTLSDTELEKFVRDWVEARVQTYLSFKNFSGSQDLGRDVVGFKDPEKHEGRWDNYQCKQYGRTLNKSEGILEVGKILYYAHENKYKLPENYYFVAPRGVNRSLEDIIYNPEKFKAAMLSEWDKVCKNKITTTKSIELTDSLIEVINSYDYRSIDVIDVDGIINDPSSKKALYKWFGADVGPAPKGEVPNKISEKEQVYVTKVFATYSEKYGGEIFSIDDFSHDHMMTGHFKMQRQRFYHADAFKRFYRDNTNEDLINNLEEEVISGVFDVIYQEHDSSFHCLNSVMKHAGTISVSGDLSEYTTVPVKQGLCHHAANEDKLEWIS